MSKVSSKKQNIISLLILVVGVFLAFRFFGIKKDGQEGLDNKVAPVSMVKVMKIGEDSSKTALISRTSIFESIESADAVAEQGGRIANVNFQVGDQVERGQVLAVFDQSSFVNSAKVALDDSLNNLELAEDNLEKTRESIEEGLEIAKNNKHIDELKLEQAEDDGDQDEIDLAEKDLDNSKDAEDKAEQDSKIAVNNAKLQVAQSQGAVNQNRIAYEKSIIRAPISGVVTSKKVYPYDYINAGSKIAEISGESILKTKIFLNSFEIERVFEEDQVIIEIEGVEYPGKIASLSGVANSNNNRYEAQIESLGDISKKANQAAQIKINLKLNSEQDSQFFVPLSAVIIGQQSNTVFVEKNGKALMIQVEINKTVSDQIQVTSGLNAGDNLIVENNRGLKNGEIVKVQ